MEGTSVVIVLLFVFAIFSSLPQGSPSHTYQRGPVVKSTAPRSDLFGNSLNVADLPPAECVVVPSQNIEERIRRFIVSYARATHRKYAQEIATAIMKYSRHYDVNPRLVAAVIARESRFNPRAVSSHGAQGLGQLLPSTARSMGVRNYYDIDQNVMGTTKYLKYLLDTWRGQKMRVPLSLASYLAGPNAVKKSTGLTASTQSYVNGILRVYKQI